MVPSRSRPTWSSPVFTPMDGIRRRTGTATTVAVRGERNRAAGPAAAGGEVARDEVARAAWDSCGACAAPPPHDVRVTTAAAATTDATTPRTDPRAVRGSAPA